jgi:hypothetical protein
MEQIFQTDIKSNKRAYNINALLKTYFSISEVKLIKEKAGAKYVISTDQSTNLKIISLIKEFGYKCELILKSSR